MGFLFFLGRLQTVSLQPLEQRIGVRIPASQPLLPQTPAQFSVRIILQGDQRMNRRGFFQRGVHLAAAAASALAVHPGATWAQGKVARAGGVKLKLGLNAYSFDRPLRAGEMTLEDLVVYCAQNGFDALDATGYYFPGYPKVPDDDTIRSLKKKAYLNGVTLSSTGVRNDFSLPEIGRASCRE